MGILRMRAKTTVFDTGYRACVPDTGIGEKVSEKSSSRKLSISVFAAVGVEEGSGRGDWSCGIPTLCYASKVQASHL